MVKGKVSRSGKNGEMVSRTFRNLGPSDTGVIMAVVTVRFKFHGRTVTRVKVITIPDLPGGAEFTFRANFNTGGEPLKVLSFRILTGTA
jgi:hypothetical protein